MSCSVHLGSLIFEVKRQSTTKQFSSPPNRLITRIAVTPNGGGIKEGSRMVINSDVLSNTAGKSREGYRSLDL